MIDVVRENPRYGVSDYDNFFQCELCCFCGRHMPVTLAQRQLMASLASHVEANTTWQDDIERRINEYMLHTNQVYVVERPVVTITIGYRQQLHAVCGSVMTESELEEMVAHGKDRVYIPDRGHRNVNILLDYAALANSGQPAPLCERCDSALSYVNQGMCYPMPGGVRKYLHFECFETLRDLRRARESAEKAGL